MPNINLYALGAAVVACLLLLTWGTWERATIADYETQIATMNGEMAQAKASHDLAIANLNTTLETTHAAHSQEITAVGTELQRAAAELDRLRANPGPGRCDQVRPAAVYQEKPPVVGATPSGHTSVVSSSGSYAFRADIDTRCLEAASYAEDARAWAMSPQVSQ